MDALTRLADFLEELVWGSGIPVGDETVPFVVIALLGAGVWFTFRLGFIQIRRFNHGMAVAFGRYDKEDDPRDLRRCGAAGAASSPLGSMWTGGRR